jgi:hypothetical protein
VSSELLQATTRLLEEPRFPSTAEGYRDSCQDAISLALHDFWSTIQPPVGVELGEFQFRTKAIHAAHMLMSEGPQLDSPLEVEDSSYTSTRGSKKRKQPQVQKHDTATSVSQVAQGAFECLGEEPPQNLEEKSELVKRLLNHQQASLKVCTVQKCRRRQISTQFNCTVLPSRRVHSADHRTSRKDSHPSHYRRSPSQ